MLYNLGAVMRIILSEKAKSNLEDLRKENKSDYEKVIRKIFQYLDISKYENGLDLLKSNNQIKTIRRKNGIYQLYELKIMNKNNFRIFFHLAVNTIILGVVKKKVNSFDNDFFSKLEIELSDILDKG